MITTRAPKLTKDALLMVLVMSYPFFLLGYDVVVSLVAIPIMDGLHISPYEASMYVDIMSYAPTMGGAIVAGASTNFHGHFLMTGFGGGLYIVGVLITNISQTYFGTMFGRALTGFGTGMGLLVGPIYIAESAPSNARGCLGYFPRGADASSQHGGCRVFARDFICYEPGIWTSA
ncbi:Polyol transporter 5 [Linum perenne]